MSTQTRLNEVFNNAKAMPFSDSSKFILFSDCHRGDNSWADDFAHNQAIFCHALRHFWKRLQLLGVKEPTSPAKNFRRRAKNEGS